MRLSLDYYITDKSLRDNIMRLKRSWFFQGFCAGVIVMWLLYVAVSTFTSFSSIP